MKPQVLRRARWRGRPAAGLCLVVLALAGCVPSPAEPQVTVTTPPEVPVINEARSTLSAPVVTVDVAIERVVDGVDAVRHSVPRGPQQQQAIADVRVDIQALRNHVEALRIIGADLDGPLVADAVEAGDRLADLGESVADEADDDLDELEPLLAIDERMSALVDDWDRRGSRSQQAAAFTEMLGTAADLELDARRLPVLRCQTVRRNRITWAALLHTRTQMLTEAVIEADGLSFDGLRAEFGRAPYGEDRVVADAEDAVCWTRVSPLAIAPAQSEDLLLEVQDALNRR